MAVSADLSDGEIEFLVNNICGIRNRALLEGDFETVSALYNTDKRNGRYACDHEEKKIKYLANWSEKQGVEFTYIESTALIKWYKKKAEDIWTINMLLSTEYRYI